MSLPFQDEGNVSTRQNYTTLRKLAEISRMREGEKSGKYLLSHNVV